MDRGPVIVGSSAAWIAAGPAGLTAADLAVSVAGAGDPGDEEEKTEGTVFIAIHSAAGSRVEAHHFSREPEHPVQTTTFHAQRLLNTVSNGLAGHLANAGGHGKSVDLPLEQFWIMNNTIITALMNTNTTETLLKLVAQKTIPVGRFVSRTFNLTGIERNTIVFRGWPRQRH